MAGSAQSEHWGVRKSAIRLITQLWGLTINTPILAQVLLSVAVALRTSWCQDQAASLGPPRCMASEDAFASPPHILWIDMEQLVALLQVDCWCWICAVELVTVAPRVALWPIIQQAFCIWAKPIPRPPGGWTRKHLLIDICPHAD